MMAENNFGCLPCTLSQQHIWSASCTTILPSPQSQSQKALLKAFKRFSVSVLLVIQSAKTQKIKESVWWRLLCSSGPPMSADAFPATFPPISAFGRTLSQSIQDISCTPQPGCCALARSVSCGPSQTQVCACGPRQIKANQLNQTQLVKLHTHLPVETHLGSILTVWAKGCECFCASLIHF